MDAIELLESQHREVEDLFDELEDAEGEEKETLFAEVADALAVHTAIEEAHLYPAAKGSRTDEQLHEATTEHLAIKRVLADLLRLHPEDDEFESKLALLEEQVEHHFEEEEKQVFPALQKHLGAAELEAIGDAMEALSAELLKAGDPRQTLLDEEEEEAAPLQPRGTKPPSAA